MLGIHFDILPIHGAVAEIFGHIGNKHKVKVLTALYLRECIVKIVLLFILLGIDLDLSGIPARNGSAVVVFVYDFIQHVHRLWVDTGLRCRFGRCGIHQIITAEVKIIVPVQSN